MISRMLGCGGSLRAGREKQARRPPRRRGRQISSVQHPCLPDLRAVGAFRPSRAPGRRLSRAEPPPRSATRRHFALLRWPAAHTGRAKPPGRPAQEKICHMPAFFACGTPRGLVSSPPPAAGATLAAAKIRGSGSLLRSRLAQGVVFGSCRSLKFDIDEGICGRFGSISMDGLSGYRPTRGRPDDVGVSFTVCWVSVSARERMHDER